MRHGQPARLLMAMVVMWAAESLAHGTPAHDGHAHVRPCTSALRVHTAGQGDTHTWRQAPWCLAYVAGFADGHTVATVDAALGSRALCPPDGWRPAEQLARMLVEWLHAHPTQLGSIRSF